jgi:hypothetical protein
MEKKLSSWKDKHLSVGGRLILINYVLKPGKVYAIFLRSPEGSS